MSKWQKHFFLAAAVITAAGLLGMFGAGSAIAQIRAALVNDINNPAHQPVRLAFSEAIPNGEYQHSSGATPLYTVPAGKRLVIDYLYARAYSDGGQTICVFLLQQSGLVEYQFPIEQKNTVGGISDRIFYHASTPVHIFYEPGWSVRVFSFRNLLGGDAWVDIRLTGYLVDLQ